MGTPCSTVTPMDSRCRRHPCHLKAQLRLPMLPSRCWPVLTGDAADLHALAAQTNQVTVIGIQGSCAGDRLDLETSSSDSSTPRPSLARRVGSNQTPVQFSREW